MMAHLPTSTACHLVVMSKVPRLGRVKTRLAADIGIHDAQRFYTTTLGRTLRKLGSAPWRHKWQCWLAASPDRDTLSPRLWPAPWATPWQPIPQGTGDLGERMAHLFQHLPPGPVVIVGGDIPDIQPAHIAQAFACLGTHNGVFGPAQDGGYWLVGLRRRPCVPSGLFENVRWSSAHALRDSRASLPRHWRVATLATLLDIDDGADFARWQKTASS